MVKKPQLIVGTGSTWSLRAWMCLKLASVEFSEHVVVLENKDFKKELLAISPTGLVPVFNHGELSIHDSLAIAEFANELSNGDVFPRNLNERALARSYCAELHSGFFNLRNSCPFTIEKQTPVDLTFELQNELSRLNDIWVRAKGDFFFESPTVVDAFYAVLAYRLNVYGIIFSGKAGQYQQALLQWPLFELAIEQVKQWNEAS